MRCSVAEHMYAGNLPQVHLRHLVGGRARSFMGELPHERIFQVDFPERPGALRKFLSIVSPAFLITLFHYRKTGAMPSASVLVVEATEQHHHLWFVGRVESQPPNLAEKADCQS